MNTEAGKIDAPKSAGRRAWALTALGVAGSLGIVAVALGIDGDTLSALARVPARLKAPDFHLIARESLTLKLHLAAAVTALAVGIVIMLRPKGVGLHKTLGWTWVIAMAVTAVSSLFLSGINGDSMSFIHFLSGWVIIVLPLGVAAIRNRNVSAHRRTMTGLFVGGLVVAGALTFIPGRLMWQVFFA
jgi:uncharacterized membrane protein